MNGVLGTALSGLQAAATRVGAAANNIANISTSGSTDGVTKPAYTPQDVVQTSTNGGVRADIQPRDPATYAAPDPDASFADADGMVAVPNIDVASEIVSMKTAEHAYKASLIVSKTAQEMDDALNELI